MKSDFKYSGGSAAKKTFVEVVNWLVKSISTIQVDLGAARGGTNIVTTKADANGVVIDFTRVELGTTLPDGDVGQIIYNDGADWVVLDKPGSVQVLQNTSLGVLSWVDASEATIPTGTVGELLYNNGSAWVTLPKPSADKILQNDASGSLTWIDNDVGDVTMKSANPFQEDKLVFGSSVSKELWGSTIGLNVNGASIGVYTDLWIATEARVAAIALDLNTEIPLDNIVGSGVIGEVAVYDGTYSIGSSTMTSLLDQVFGTHTPSVFHGSNASGIFTGSLTDIAPNAVEVSGGVDRSIIYHNGSSWAVLSPPSVDSTLMNDGGTSGLRWESGASLPSGGSQYQVLQRDGSGDAVWDYVRAH